MTVRKLHGCGWKNSSHISKIENCACVTNIMKITLISGIEEVKWGAASMLEYKVQASRR